MRLCDCKTESNSICKCIFASPIDIVQVRHNLQQTMHIGEENCIGGERRCKIASPLSSNAFRRGGRGQGGRLAPAQREAQREPAARSSEGCATPPAAAGPPRRWREEQPGHRCLSPALTGGSSFPCRLHDDAEEHGRSTTRRRRRWFRVRR
jgi:hypothetical protein